MDRIPLLIPLGNGSLHNDDELRMLLRSVERNVEDCGKIYLMTMFKPDWLRESDDLVVVPLPDPYNDGKDANLISKTNETIRRYGIGEFVWSADDAVVLKPIRFSEIPVLHNHRPNSIFKEPNQGKWRARVWNTLEWARKRGVELPHTYEVHCPQRFDGQAILANMTDFYPDQKTIYTFYRVITDSWHGSLNQPVYKWTFENPIDESVSVMPDEELCSKPFLGYSDSTADRVLARLHKLFPDKSRFEK